MLLRFGFGVLLGFLFCFIWVQLFTESRLETENFYTEKIEKLGYTEKTTEDIEKSENNERSEYNKIFKNQLAKFPDHVQQKIYEEEKSIKEYIYRSFIYRLDGSTAKSRAEAYRKILQYDS